MIACPSRRHTAFAAAVVIGLGSFAGSATELYRVAERANYGVPLALVAALDGLAVVCVISLSVRRDWQAGVTLAVVTAMSAGLQVMSVPTPALAPAYLSAVAVHVLVPVASFMAVHLATRLDVVPPRPRMPRPVPPKPVPVTPHLEARVPEPAAAPVRRRAPSAEDLVPVARKLLAELDLSPHAIGRPRLTELMKAADHSIGSTKAEELLKLLRSEVPS